jgi:hypothetical protein
MVGKGKKSRLLRHWPRFLLIIPFLLVAYVPFYNRTEPTLGGIPFFYWYQLAAILLGAAVVVAVYLLETRITGPVDGASEEIDTSGTPGDIL